MTAATSAGSPARATAAAASRVSSSTACRPLQRLARMRFKVSARHFSSSVVPLQPPSNASRGPSVVATRRKPEPTFRHAFGALGVPLLLTVCVSIVWTAWLIVLNVAPNATANFLMDTTEFDDGSFWLIIDPDPVVLIVACLGLTAVLLGYLYALAAMTVLRTRRFGAKATLSFSITRKVLGERVAAAWSAFTGFQGYYRKLWNLWLKTIDLALQSVTLSEVLEEGFPTTLCYMYAALVAANCFSCAFTILHHKKLTAFTEVLIDTMFDMLVAVVAPIILLLYSYNNFHFDREAFRVVLEVARPGSFERHARMSADPTQATLFLINLNALRIQSALGFVVRIGMNLSFAYRLKRIVEVTSEHAGSIGNIRRIHIFSSRSLAKFATQKVVPKWATLPFFGAGCALLIYTHQCISSSQASCSRYPECAAHAHRVVGNRNLCPCIAVIDVDKAPKTFAEWTNPHDATKTLAELARSGDLRVLELTNRKLLELPKELHVCTGLRHISLMYTGVQAIPAWAKDFEQLEFLNIEGKSGDVNLVNMPADLFARTKALTYLHLGAHESLESLPSLEHATNLKSVSIVLLTALREFPSLATLRHLERLELFFSPRVQLIPGLGALARLLHLVVLNLAASCNGSLGHCDASWAICSDIVCSAGAYSPDAAALRVVQRFRDTVATLYVDTTGFFDPLTARQVDLCGGVLYRQCSSSGVDTGTEICINDRMQVVVCVVSPMQITIRRLQIQRRVGDPCDPEVEAWLGCARA